MSNAFEVTPDDVLNVVHRMGKKISEEKCHEIHDALDHFKIEDEALRANDLDAQTDAAYDEIERQIKENKLL
jgi:hypothetical protein